MTTLGIISSSSHPPACVISTVFDGVVGSERGEGMATSTETCNSLERLFLLDWPSSASDRVGSAGRGSGPGWVFQALKNREKDDLDDGRDGERRSGCLVF